MGDRQAQEFWDQMWYYERYETFPSESTDDPHLVIGLGAQVDNGNNDPALLARFDACVGRVLERLTNLLPRTGEEANLEEFSNWLLFGLRPGVRGHDGAPDPIIDANSLVIFLRFCRYAVDYCQRHGLAELEALWSNIQNLAQLIDDEHTGEARSTRFDPEVVGGKS